MRFTSQEEYGLRCMVQMARHEARGPLTIGDIARTEKLGNAYVGKIMRVLRQGGMVEAQHGPAGGYRLPRPAVDMNVGEILAVLGGRLFEAKYCEKFGGEQPFCVHTTECSIRSLWSGLDLIVDQILRRTSLAELVRTEHTMSAWIRRQVPVALEAAARASIHPGPVGSLIPVRAGRQA